MDTITVIDFGGQYTHLIAERLRDRGFYAVVAPPGTPLEQLSYSRGIILSGGPKSVYDDGAPRCDPGIFQGDIPVLGICYGAQLMAHCMGGKVQPGETREYGKNSLLRQPDGSALFDGLDEAEPVWMSHGDCITDAGPAFDIIGTSASGIIAAIRARGREVYGVQFHPEVKHTPRGLDVLENFAGKICGSRKEWTGGSDIEDAVGYIRETVGNSSVGAMTSFGVDSSVAAKLTSMSYGDKALILYVSGLDRKGDPERAERLAGRMDLHNFHIVDAEDRFIGSLSGITDPQAQRNVIGNLYVELFDDYVEGMGWDKDKTFFVQGTLYTDRVESGEGVGSLAANIKTHHNVGASLIMEKKQKGLIVEPNKWKYKDGARKRARALGLPDEIVNAQPFPGPGLALRMINEVGIPEDVAGIYGRANGIVSRYGLNGYVFPIRTVGVIGDQRAYMNLLLTEGNPDFQDRAAAATEVVNRVRGIGRVAYSFSRGLDQAAFLGTKPLAFDKKNLRLLREIDDSVNEAARGYGLMGKISQMPVILFPGPGKPWVGIRPVGTEDYMTAAPVEFPARLAGELTEKLMGSYDLGGVAFDDTSKPPATIEWK